MSYQIDLSGRIALVTGASRGLGTQFAKTLAQAGAKVVLAARRIERLEALQTDIEGRGGLFIRRIEGCYSNVIGLPMPAGVHRRVHRGRRAAPRLA